MNPYAIIDVHEKKWPFWIRKEYDAEKVVIWVPKFASQQARKVAKRVCHLLTKEHVKKVVLSQELLRCSSFCRYLREANQPLAFGKRMYGVLLPRILKEIANQMQIPVQTLKVALLIEEYCCENVDLLETIAKEVKELTVVTNEASKFQRVSEQLLEKYGIPLKVVENQVATLKEEQIIMNVDFAYSAMQALSLPPFSLVFCGNLYQLQLPQGFHGIFIKKIDVLCPKNKNLHLDGLSLCEAQMYSYQRKIKENDRVFEREGYQIKGYFGENGRLTSNEFQKLGKILLDK